MAKKIDYVSLFTLRADGRYQASYTDATGRHYLYDRDPAALYKRKEALLASLSSPEEPPEYAFEEIAEAWHNKHWTRIREGTKACYNAPYRRAIDMFGQTDAGQISSADIYAHLCRLRDQGMSAKSIKTQRTIYKLIFQNAIFNEQYGKIIRVNPAADIPLPPAIKPPVKRTAPENDIIQRIRESAESAYFGLFALVLISTGFRRGEALALKWGDVDFRKKAISCSKSVIYRGTAVSAETKTQSGVRTVPLLPDLEAVLKRPANAKSSDFIFFGTDPSKCMCESTYRRRWLSYCKEMGFVTDEPEERVSKHNKKYIVHHYKPSLTPHVFRHGYATMLFEADVDVYTAQKLLGHANIETTMAIYTHLRNEKERQSVGKLREHVSNALKTNDVKYDVNKQKIV